MEVQNSDAVALSIEPRLSDLGGFHVRRMLPHAKRRMVGPWIFFDHMGPVTFEPGHGMDVRPHPHINLATVTYLFEGEIVHRDSLGYVETIRPGDINLMIAGRGIVHSERTGSPLREAGHALHGLQLWLALPAELEENEPEFLHYDADALPTCIIGDVPVRVMIGSAYGVNSPVKQLSPTLYLEATLLRGQSLPLPDGVGERAVYLASGLAHIGETSIKPATMAVLNNSNGIVLKAMDDSRIALIGGESVGDRQIWWNFVSSRRDRIAQAKQDWLENHFARVPGETEFIPLPDQ
jgi:hypothetical protein